MEKNGTIRKGSKIRGEVFSFIELLLCLYLYLSFVIGGQQGYFTFEHGSILLDNYLFKLSNNSIPLTQY